MLNDNHTADQPLTGSCLCGALRYRIDAAIEALTHCHCSQCRKGHGAAFASYANVRSEQFRFTSDEQALGRYESSPGVTRSFCRACGSTLLWHSQNNRPNWLSVAVGTLDTALGELAQKHIHTESKADWYAIHDGLPIEHRP